VKHQGRDAPLARAESNLEGVRHDTRRRIRESRVIPASTGAEDGSVSARQVAVLTSGGDAPGMNAAIRSFVRTGKSLGLETWGVENGYRGLVDGALRRLDAHDVGGILQASRTVLGTARCPEFKDPAVRSGAIERLQAMGIEGLAVIGGNGSQTGARALSDGGMRVVGIASTIDNDLAGTERSIGFDTAVSVAVEALDRIRVTASSHQRIFLVEVMGRDSGHIALHSGVAGGAEAIVLPEIDVEPGKLLRGIADSYRRKDHAVVVVAEGAEWDARRIAEYIHAHGSEVGLHGVGTRVTILGHVQRGAAPSPADRILASQLAAAAATALAEGRSGILLGSDCRTVVSVDLDDRALAQRPLDRELLQLAEVLAR